MVSEIAGTTRDVIEECVNIEGVLFRFLDTAGIRDTTDRLEQMGIQRTLASIDRAHIVIRMEDAADIAANNGARAEFTLRADQKLLAVANKLDTVPSLTLPEGTIGISAKSGTGIEELRQSLRQSVDTAALYHGDVIVSNSRHIEALTAARQSLDDALQSIACARSSDLLSEDIRQVLHHIGIITGEITTTEILSNIFSKFCIGK